MPEENKLRKVCIVMPVHNRRDITLLCLRSLKRADKKHLDVKIIVVDDGSTDGTSEAIRSEFPEVEIVEGDGNLWYTEGTNVGVRKALDYNPDYVLMCNNDQIFEEKSLQYLVETAERNERSVVGGLLLLWDQPHKVFQTSPVWSTLLGGWRHWKYQTIWTVPSSPWEVELIVGNCVLVPAKAIKEAGLMDSQHFPNFGDAEYTPRLRKLGWRLLIDPRARIFCQPNTIPTKVKTMNLKTKLNVLLIDLKHPQNLRRRFYAYWFGAPSKLQGLIAFIIFLIRVLLRKNIESDSWALKQNEKPLKEMLN